MVREHGLQKSARTGYYKRYVTYYVRDNYPILIFSMIFICGVWLGSSFLSRFDEDTLTTLVSLLNGFMVNREEQEFLTTFMSSLTPSLVFTLLLFFCGFCAISQPIIVLVPFFKGLGFGLSASSMLLYYDTKAVLYIALLLLPSTVITTVAVVLCCKEAFRLSMGFFSLINPLTEVKHSFSIGGYCIRFAGLAGLCVIGALVESGLYTVFSIYGNLL